MQTMLSGHCHRESIAEDPDEATIAHNLCHVVYPRQTGGYYTCPCPRHAGENRCRICRHDHHDNIETYDVATHRCADNDACTRRIRPESQAVKEQIAAARAANSRTRPSRDCECGCGGTTRGGRFQPGHDAKLKSDLLRRAADGDTNAGEELRTRGWVKW